jgi:dCMP deaminase
MPTYEYPLPPLPPTPVTGPAAASVPARVFRVPRPSFADTMYDLAWVWSKRSTCPRLAVGVVICNQDWQVLVSGYNGAVRGQPHCTHVGCLMVEGHCLRAVHGEMNALAQAARIGISLDNSQIFLTHNPCLHCVKPLIQAGIGEIHFDQLYGPVSEELCTILGKSGIPLFQRGGGPLNHYIS